jgi:sulfide dehydrogenase cytochrome subunit
MPTMKSRHSISTTLRPTLAVGAAFAATGLMAAPPPGQLLSSMCSQCHGTNGLAVSGFESISGKSATDMYKTLLEMSQRRPENIMDLQARAFTPEQLRLIATYLATLPPAGSETLNK